MTKQVTVKLTEDQANYLWYWLDEQAKWLSDKSDKKDEMAFCKRIITKLAKELDKLKAKS